MKSFVTVALFSSAICGTVSAFRGLPQKSMAFRGLKTLRSSPLDQQESIQDVFMPFSDMSLMTEKDHASRDLQTAAFIGAAASLFLPLEEAFAKDGEYGIFENRAASMLHPLTMAALFCTSLYSAYLGLQWRRLRGLGDEMKFLSSQLPVLSSGPAKFPVSDMLTTINTEIATLQSATELPTPTGAQRLAALQKDIEMLRGAASLDAKMSELSDTRKSLLSANLRDKHYTTGSWLLGAGVTVSIMGAFNTYMRAGKLFPGPHLYAGMAVTILWAAAAALVPAMQKGNEAARIGHIAFNTINVALFAWQVVSGFDIAVKVWGFTHW